MKATASAGPSVEALFGAFPPAGDFPSYELVPAERVPAPYHDLLVHEHHMTVTVEAHHGCHVDVRVLARVHSGNHYARKSLLIRQSDGRVVQFGIARIDLTQVSPTVRDAILAANVPIGRILIAHDVLRRIEPTAFLRMRLGPKQLGWFGLERVGPTYGRLALIHCNGRPALELLEVVAPEGERGA
jgi:chorismate-pyruvate lyase